MILRWASSAESPFLDMVTPRYVKDCTTSSCIPFTWIPTLLYLMVFPMTLIFSVLISIPYTLTLVESLSVRVCNSLLLPAIRSMIETGLVVLECIALDFIQVDRTWWKLASLSHTWHHGKELTHWVILAKGRLEKVVVYQCICPNWVIWYASPKNLYIWM